MKNLHIIFFVFFIALFTGAFGYVDQAVALSSPAGQRLVNPNDGLLYDVGTSFIYASADEWESDEAPACADYYYWGVQNTDVEYGYQGFSVGPGVCSYEYLVFPITLYVPPPASPVSDLVVGSELYPFDSVDLYSVTTTPYSVESGYMPNDSMIIDNGGSVAPACSDFNVFSDISGGYWTQIEIYENGTYVDNHHCEYDLFTSSAEYVPESPDLAFQFSQISSMLGGSLSAMCLAYAASQSF
jgi:hypothetical protein